MGALAKAAFAALEVGRKVGHGKAATLKLLKLGSNNARVVHSTLTKAFFLESKTEIASGERYILCQIAEQTGAEAADFKRCIAVEFNSKVHKVSVVDSPLTEDRIWKLRLSPTGE